MNSATRAHAPHTNEVADEKISLRRIRLVLRRQQITAIVGTFLAADKVLLSWAGRAEEAIECEFEIMYADGYTLTGEYRLRGKAIRRPTLMAFIRMAAQSLCEGSASGPLVRGLSDCPHRFLMHYEITDFTPSSETSRA
jgi:hypothetical protein